MKIIHTALSRSEYAIDSRGPWSIHSVRELSGLLEMSQCFTQMTRMRLASIGVVLPTTGRLRASLGRNLTTVFPSPVGVAATAAQEPALIFLTASPSVMPFWKWTGLSRPSGSAPMDYGLSGSLSLGFGDLV